MNDLTTSLGYGLSALTWTIAGLLLLSRRPTASSRPTLFWLLAAVIGECAWAIHALPSVSVQMPPWLGAALHALRFLLFSAFMLALLRGLRDLRILIFAASLATTLAIAQGLGAVIQSPLMIQQTLALLAALFCILCVEQVYRNAVPDQRWLLKFACLATFLLFAFEALLRADALLHGGVDPTLLTAQGFVDALIAPLMAVGGLRLLPTKQQLRFSRDAAFHTATLLVSGLFLLAMAAIGYGLRIFGSTWGAVLQWILLFAAAITLLVLLGSGQVRAKIRVWINKHFFSQRYDYRKEWMRLTSLLSGSSSLEDQKRTTATRGLQALVDMVESTGGQIWTQDVAGTWRLRARLNVAAGPDLAAHDGLAEFLGTSGWIIDIDDWRDGRSPQGCPPMVGWLKSDTEAWLLMAVSVQSVPVALVQLQRPLAPIPLDWEVRDLLKAAGQQVAGLLRTEQALESLVQARQFDSFNRMSAFVVHDLKNLVAQLGLMLKNAERHRDNPQFQADMLETAAHVQERMQSMLLQLRDGTRPIEAVQPVDLDACL
jgi:putative PEP-CTERM system histidine kinase